MTAMATFTVEIHPKKIDFDPVARSVRSELLEAGEQPKNAEVHTSRLFRIEGNFSEDQVKTVAETLLLDPVVETFEIEADGAKTGKAKKAAVKNGWVLDIWPKPGVTDPVGETVEKGLRDLGFSGPVKAATAQRFVFPKIQDGERIRTLARRVLANELIHDIHIRKAGSR